jgi:hypothetical protein
VGRAQSVAEIAERERVGSRYVRRLRLAFLAPEIVEAIAAGDQPPELTAEVLAERIDLPLLSCFASAPSMHVRLIFKEATIDGRVLFRRVSGPRYSSIRRPIAYSNS